MNGKNRPQRWRAKATGRRRRKSASASGADPNSVWITYRLSRDLVSAGEQAQADTLMRNMVSRKPGDAERVYAWGLYLSGNNPEGRSGAWRGTLPRKSVDG